MRMDEVGVINVGYTDLLDLIKVSSSCDIKGDGCVDGNMYLPMW